MDISLDIILVSTKFSTCIQNILMQGKVSQNSYLGLSFYLRQKTGNFGDFSLFFRNIYFLYGYQQYVLKFSSINVGK